MKRKKNISQLYANQQIFEKKSTMRLSLWAVLSAQCFFVGMNECKQITRSTKTLQSQEPHSRFEEIILKVEAKLENFESKLESFQAEFEKFDAKLEAVLEYLENFDEKINDKSLDEKLSDASLTINRQLVLWNGKISELDRKLSRLINQSDEHFYDIKRGLYNEPLPETSQMEFQNLLEELKEAFESSSNKKSQNIAENVVKIDQFKRFLQTIFGEAAIKNITRSNDFLMQIQRRERKATQNISLINEILTMVKNRLKSKEEEIDVKNISESAGSLTSMVSSFENMKSSTLSQRNKTTLPPRKDRIIFPNVKNKPATINTTFTSESSDPKGFRVRFVNCD